MSKIYVGGVGGAPSNNFVASLRMTEKYQSIVGGSSSPTDLFLADVDRAYVVPAADSPGYAQRLLEILKSEKPDLIHVQNDAEVLALSALRDDVHALGVKTFLPAHSTICNCVDKAKSYEFWKKSKIKVPETMLIENEADLTTAFREFGTTIWLRATTGGGGRGSLRADNPQFAKMWIDLHKGWGNFTAAECLTPNSVTWSSIWHEGELIVAQTRGRHSWHFGNRTLSGITGVTGVGETQSHPIVTEISQRAIAAIDDKPHGIFSVDLTYDSAGIPNPTEINIGRFFTTHLFFAKAGLNLAEIFCDLALTGKKPVLSKKINPLPDGLLWIRGMDVPPKLTNVVELEKLMKDGYVAGANHERK